MFKFVVGRRWKANVCIVRLKKQMAAIVRGRWRPFAFCLLEFSESVFGPVDVAHVAGCLEGGVEGE